MITLHQPPAAWGLSSLSPFCTKLETYLRMTGIEYQVKGGDVFAAPKGRIPYVQFEDQMMGDSTLIIQELKKRWGDKLDADLSPEQRAHALALQRLVEDHLYFCAAWLRWSDEASWKYVQEYFKKLMPPVVGRFIVPKIRKGMLKDLRTHGVGEHTRQEIIDFAKADLTALSDSLGKKNFFMGDQPTTLDATAYGFLVHLMEVPWDNPIKQHAWSLDNLAQYSKRMKEKYWS
jgi:glutathione S-transferase